MSLQDESFPEDEFLEELDISGNDRHYQYPICRDKIYKNSNTTSTTNSSACSADQNLSSESGNERPGSDLSGKTSASDPTGLSGEDGKNEKQEIRNNKAFSYMDIHSEYTKRRYKHVESKVGQYIAKMKAEDQKLRNKQKKFIRHRSMPETIGRESEEVGDNLDGNNRHHAIRYSSVEIRKFDDSSDAEVDSSGNRSSRNQTDNSDDVLILAKQAYSQLVAEKDRAQSYNEYLQQKLDEKSSEVLRLKRNIDYLRIEVTDYQDKLKRQSSLATSHGLNSSLGFYNSGNLSALTRQSSLQVFTHNSNNNIKSSKATQTEFVTPTPKPSKKRIIPCDMFTPESLDSNNNSLADIKSDDIDNPSNPTANENINNDQGVLRQRSNSNQMLQPVKQANINAGHLCYPSSSDSAIDIESIEMQSPIGHRFRREKRTIRINARELLNTTIIEFSPQNENNPNLNNNSITALEENSLSNPHNLQLKEKKKKKNSLRWRVIRFLGPCAGCEDVNPVEVSFTQVPLLERTPENYCRNMR